MRLADLGDELELAATLLAKGEPAILAAQPIVKPEMLASDEAARIVGACYEMARTRTHIDVVTVAERTGLSIRAVDEISDYPVTDAAWIASRVRDAHERRVLASTLARAQLALVARPRPTAQRVASQLAGELMHLTAPSGSAGFTTAADSGEWAELVAELASPPPPDGLVGVPFGWPSIDQYTGGVLGGEVVIFSAAPGGAKTVSLVNVASYNTLKRTVPVPFGFVSAEMTRKALWRRIIADLAQVDTIALRTRRFTPDESRRIVAAMARIEAAPLHIDDSPAPTVADLFARARALKARHPALAGLCIDYLQLVQGSEENRAETLRAIAYGVKALAKDLNIPVFTAAQLNDKQVEHGQQPRKPQLSDLQGSSGIRQAADFVFMQYVEGATITLDGQKVRELAPRRWALRPELQYQRLVDSHTLPFGGHA